MVHQILLPLILDTYPIDLICLAFVVNGDRCQYDWMTPIVWHSLNLHVIFLPVLKISFFFKLEWLKILKDIFEEDYPIVATEISRNFIFPFYSESFLSLA